MMRAIIVSLCIIRCKTDEDRNGVGDACEDSDGDFEENSVDRDDDNNGLIEIYFLDDLESMIADWDGNGQG